MYWFTITVYHAGKWAGTEIVKARDLHHAHKLAVYVSSTVAKDHVRPSEFNEKLVTFNVE